MRSVIIIVGGLVLLAVVSLVGWRMGGPHSALTAVKLFIPGWFILAMVNMWLGVSHAGYSVGEELPIFAVIFAIPAAAAASLWWRLS
jgi:hypothetical protein